MRLTTWLPRVSFRAFALSLIPTTVGYFALVRVLQDSFVPLPPPNPDPYPGYPLRPEPWEAPLYLLGYLVIPCLTLAWAYAWRRRWFRTLVAAGVLAAAVGSAAVALPALPAAVTRVQEYLATRSLADALWLVWTKRLFIVRLSFAAALIAGLLSWWRRPQLAWLAAARQWPVLEQFVPYFFVLLAAVVFEPRLPYIEGNTNFALGPIHEALHGKALIYETASLYGLLNAYLAMLVFAVLLPLTPQSFSLIVMALYFLFYLALYRALKLWLGSTFLALAGTWLGVIGSFLLLSDPYLTPYHVLGQNVFRHGFFILPAWLLARFGASRRPRDRELTMLAAAAGFFWNPETGVFTVAAVLAALGCDVAARDRQPWRERLRHLAALAGRQIGYLMLVGACITAVNVISFGQWPNWPLQFAQLTVFENGYGKLPMPALGLYQGFVAVYLAALAWVVFRWRRREAIPLLVPFLAVFGAGALLYYVGNSAWSYLNLVSIPAVILLLYALDQSWRFGEPFSRRLAVAGWCALLTFAAVMTVAKVGVVFAGRDYTAISFTALPAQDRPLADDAAFLRALTPAVRIPVFHEDDGKLLILAGKVNLLNFTDATGTRVWSSLYDDLQAVFRSHVRGLITQVERQQPTYVVITNRSDPRFDDFRNAIEQSYEVERRLNTLTIYRRKAREAPPVKP